MSFIRRHPLLVGLLVGALVLATPFVATAVAVWQAAHRDDASRLARADVIIVLGAAQYGGRPSPVFEGRLRHAALMFRDGRADRVLVLGAGQPGDETTEAVVGRRYLIEEHGLPADAVFAAPVGSTTYESLGAAARFMRAHGLETAFLVSDPWHNLRVKRMAHDLGIEGYASATWQSAARTEGTRLTGYLRETLAYLYYRLFNR